LPLAVVVAATDIPSPSNGTRWFKLKLLYVEAASVRTITGTVAPSVTDAAGVLKI
jgi:hypothetical protein